MFIPLPNSFRVKDKKLDIELEKIFDKAISLQNTGKSEEAEALYKALSGQMPDSDVILMRLSLIYLEKNDLDKAEEYLIKAIKINPAVICYKVLGEVYSKKKDYNKAIECFSEALKANSDDIGLIINIGSAYSSNFKLDEAVEYYNRSLKLDPDNIACHLSLALVYDDMIELDKATEHALKAISLKPNNADAMFLLSLIFLRSGNFADGWKLYESRFYMKKPIKRIKCSKPLWEGSSLKGKTIFIDSESGMGDCIMAARFIWALNSMGAKVLYRSYQELEQLFKDSKLPATIISESEDINLFEFDNYLSMMSLPGIFNIDENNMIFKDKYLKSNPEKVKFYKEKYFDNDKFKIGIVWDCKNFFESDRRRSLPDISTLFPLIKIQGVKFYSLQKGEGEKQLNNLPDGIDIVDLGRTFNDFSDTAAAIENLDLVISVDTSVGHLAGALGKETLLMLEYLPCWRWLLNRDDNIWYDKVRLFRQISAQDWGSVINRVSEYIKEKIEN